MRRMLIACATLVLSLTAMADDDYQRARPSEHLPYLTARLQQGQLAALDTFLDSLPSAQSEPLRWWLLQGLSGSERPAAPTRTWVAAQSKRVPSTLTSQTQDGFLVSLPRYDYPALARRLLQSWQQLDWQGQYGYELAAGKLNLRSIYRWNNPNLERQQSALLAALAQAPNPVRLQLAQAVARTPLYLPDNRLIYTLLDYTGSSELFFTLWRRPVDDDSLRALALVSRFHEGNAAGELLLSAAAEPGLNSAAMLALGALHPLPDPVRSYLHRELGIGPDGVALAKLLKPRAESLQLILLADRLLHEQGGGHANLEPGRP